MLGWELPPHNSGGLGVACYHMAKAIAQEGVSIDFIVPYKAKHPESSFMNIHAATTRSARERYGLGAYDTQSISQLNLPERGGDNIRSVQREYTDYVKSVVAKDSHDAIHAHDWLTMEAALEAKKLTGAPLVVHVHATEFDRSGMKGGNPIVHEIEQQGLLMADRIIAVSMLTKQMIVHNYKIPADKIEVVHNAIGLNSEENHEYDTRTYRYLEALKSEGYTVVAAITRFTIQKGLSQLMHAAAMASDKYDKLVFLFAGDGEQRDELIALSAELGISHKVFFTGFVRGKQWRDAYKLADIFVMSSVSEPFGLTALEAAHHDTALIISKQCGVGEVLKSTLRYDFWDVERLADQFVGIATSSALQYELATNAKQEYARLSWKDVAATCLKLYRQLRIGASA